MSFEAPLGLPTANHPYAIKADIVSNNKLNPMITIPVTVHGA